MSWNGLWACWQVTDSVVTFTATCSGGTSVVVTFDFGDMSAPVVMAQPTLAEWPPGLVQSQLHSYAYGGLYIATVTVANGFQTYDFNHSLIVYGKIDNITLMTNSPVALHGGIAVAHLTFASPMPPANVQLLFNYGDGKSACITTHHRSPSKLACVYWCLWASTPTVCISMPNIVRHDFCGQNYAVERDWSSASVVNHNYCYRLWRDVSYQS